MFDQVRTVAEARRLIGRLPNSERGDAALALFHRRNIIGDEVALAALLDAWDHDHGFVLSAFGGDQAFADAVRAVAPPTSRSEPVRVWRGVSQIAYAVGISWTTDRDCACWFAHRFSSKNQNPMVFVADIDPSAILIEHAERSESEVLADPALLIWHQIIWTMDVLPISHFS